VDRGIAVKRFAFASCLLACRGGGEAVDEGPGTGSSSGAAVTTATTTTTSASSSGDLTTGEPRDLLSIDFVEIPLELPRSEITELRFFPDSNEFLMLAKPSFVYHYELVGDEAIELGFFTLSDAFFQNDCGLLSLAFDPDFANNSLFYVAACQDKDNSAVHRLVWQPGDYDAVVDSSTLVISEGDTSEYGWHNVGSIGFFPDASMWIGFGDKTHDEHGQDLGVNLGAMLRIVPDRDGAGGYEPSPRNPFPDHPDIWAYGFRVPFRATIDPCEQNCEGLVDPIVAWPHEIHGYVVDDPEAAPTTRWVPWVGPFYDPPPDLDRYDGRLGKRVLFGDMCAGWVRALEIDAEGNVTYDEHAGHLENAAAWTVGPDGFVYAVAGAACVNAEFGDARSRMYRAVPAG
jgi:hypothetical protein